MKLPLTVQNSKRLNLRLHSGWFPVSRNFYVRKCVKFTFVNEMEALYDVYAWPSICLYFIYARKIYVRTHGKITRQWKSTYSLQKCPQFDLTPGSSTNQLFLARLRRFFLPCRTLFAGDLCLKIVTQLTKKFICSSLSMSLALCYCQGTKLFCQRSSLPTC